MLENGDIEEFEWIKNGIEIMISSTDENYRGNIVGNLLPNNFSRYIKILHPMYKDKLFTDRSTLWAEDVCDEAVLGERILWRQLALEYNVEFRPEINTYAFFKENGRRWPRYLLAPDEGTLEKEQIDEITSILRPLNCEKYFFYYDWLKTLDWSQDKLFKGSLEDIYELMKLEELRDAFGENEKFSPSYWWDLNKTICICTDYDLEFTVVGCNNELFIRFMKSKSLECIEVKYDTRIDYKAMERR